MVTIPGRKLCLETCSKTLNIDVSYTKPSRCPFMKPYFKNLYLIACLALALTSCSKVYTPALFHQDIAYMPKPASFDSVGTMVYVSVGGNVHPDLHLEDMLYSGQANLSVGHRFNGFNLAYGAFAELGNYRSGNQNTTDPNYFSNLSFGAVGGRFSANLYKKMPNADFRYIGIEAAYSHEFGDFATFKKRTYNNSDFYIDPRINLFSVGLTTEVIFHSTSNPDLRHGLRGFLGVTLGHNELNNTYYSDDEASEKLFREIFPKFSYFINYRHIFGVIDVGSGFMGRVGYRF